METKPESLDVIPPEEFGIPEPGSGWYQELPGYRLVRSIWRKIRRLPPEEPYDFDA